MQMRILVLLACVSTMSITALAHNGEEHVIGTVANVTQDSIIVRTTASKVMTVTVVPETKFIEDKAAAKMSDLKAGNRVVIHAKEPTEGRFVADTVEFAAAAATQNNSGHASAEESLTGVVSDSSCDANHAMKGMSAADCTAMCIKAGKHYALVVGTEVYTLQGHEAELKKFAGESVLVKGAVKGRSVTVESVTPSAKS